MKVNKELGLNAIEEQAKMPYPKIEQKASQASQAASDLQNVVDQVEIFLRQLPARIELPEAADIYIDLVGDLVYSKQVLAAFYYLIKEHSLASVRTKSKDWDLQNIKAAASKCILSLVDKDELKDLIASMRGNMNTLKYALKPI